MHLLQLLSEVTVIINSSAEYFLHEMSNSLFYKMSQNSENSLLWFPVRDSQSKDYQFTIT